MALQLQRRLAAVTLGGLANAHASTSRASTSHIFSLASTSTSSSATPSSLRTFHSSPPTLEKRKKRVARLRKKANLSKRQEAQDILVRTAPDPVRGYGPGNENLWLDSPLRSILLDRNVVYSGRAGEVYKMLERPSEEGETEQGASLASQSADVTVTERTSMSEAESKAFGELENQDEEPTAPSQIATDLAVREAADIALENHVASEAAPVYLNFGLDPSDSSLLFEQLPRAAAHGALTERNNIEDIPDELKERRMQILQPQHEQQADALRRIVDLRNANADGIRFENTRRVVDHFGVHGGTGSPEVQAALFTMRIHNIADSMAQQPRDVHAKRNLRRLVMSRAKVLKYLKQRDLNRYVACLKDIGVEERAVLGDIVVR